MCEPFITKNADQREIWSYIGVNVDSSSSMQISSRFEDNLRSTTENWFDVYFKRDSIVDADSIYHTTPDYMKKYSLFHNATDSVNARTFFRGSMVEFVSKSDWDETVDNNLNEMKIVHDSDMNGYKFTAVCVPLTIKDASPVYGKRTKVIKNDVFKTVTLIHYIVGKYLDAIDMDVVGLDPENSNDLQNIKSIEIKNICRSRLYNPADKKAMQENESIRPISIKGYGSIKVVGNDSETVRLIGTKTSFLTDFEMYHHSDENDTASYNGNPYNKAIMLVINPDMDISYRIYSVMKITDVVSDTEMIAKPVRDVDVQNEYFTVFNQLTQAGIDVNGNQMRLTVSNCCDSYDSYYIVNCNYIQIMSSLNNCVFASLKHSINNTQYDDMIYELVDGNGTIHSSENKEFPFALKIVEPMENAKYEYMSLLYDGKWVTYGILPNYASPMFRYTGDFTPLRTDVVYFTDPFIEDFSRNPELNDSIKEKFFTGSRHLNTCFDTKVSDFGMIHDQCFHRTNELNRNVFKLTDSEKPIYPISNKFTIGNRDLQVFNSSWDPWYFTRTLSNTNEEDCSGTLAMKENKSFMGSKCLKTPDTFSFETFTISDSDTAKDIFFESKSSHIEMTVNLEDKLIETLKKNIHDIFEIYIDEQYSYGDKTTVDDDVVEYIKANLLDLYQIKDIKLWVKEETSSEEPYFVFSGMDMDNETKLHNKLSETHVMGISSIDTNQLNRKIVFNTRNRMRYTFGLSIVVDKK